MGEYLNIPDGPGQHDAAGVRGSFFLFAAFLLGVVPLAVGAQNGWSFRAFDYAMLVGAIPLGVIGIGLLKGRPRALDAYRLCLCIVAAWVILYFVAVFARFFLALPGGKPDLLMLLERGNSPQVTVTALLVLLVILACGAMLLSNFRALNNTPTLLLSPARALWVRRLIGSILVIMAMFWGSIIQTPESMGWLIGYAYQGLYSYTGISSPMQLFAGLAPLLAIASGTAGLALLVHQPWSRPAAAIAIALQAGAVALLNGGYGEWDRYYGASNALHPVPTAFIAMGYMVLWIAGAAVMIYALTRVEVVQEFAKRSN